MDRPFFLPALVVGISLIVGLWILGANIANRSNDSVITVTGSVLSDVSADTAKWQIDVSRNAPQGGTSDAYAKIAHDATIVQKYFESQHFGSSTVSASVINTEKDYNKDQNAPVSYIVHEIITVQTSDVDKIDDFSRRLGDISGAVSYGTTLVPQAPEYYVSSLPELRVSLLGKAIQDARARATAIAKNGESSVGALKSASSGVVQVLAPNSTNIEDYGSYDTSTIKKQVMVTVRAAFYVR